MVSGVHGLDRGYWPCLISSFRVVLIRAAGISLNEMYYLFCHCYFTSPESGVIVDHNTEANNPLVTCMV